MAFASLFSSQGKTTINIEGIISLKREGYITLNGVDNIIDDLIDSIEKNGCVFIGKHSSETTFKESQKIDTREGTVDLLDLEEYLSRLKKLEYSEHVKGQIYALNYVLSEIKT